MQTGNAKKWVCNECVDFVAMKAGGSVASPLEGC